MNIQTQSPFPTPNVIRRHLWLAVVIAFILLVSITGVISAAQLIQGNVTISDPDSDEAPEFGWPI